MASIQSWKLKIERQYDPQTWAIGPWIRLRVQIAYTNLGNRSLDTSPCTNCIDQDRHASRGKNKRFEGNWCGSCDWIVFFRSPPGVSKELSHAPSCALRPTVRGVFVCVLGVEPLHYGGGGVIIAGRRGCRVPRGWRRKESASDATARGGLWCGWVPRYNGQMKWLHQRRICTSIDI